MMKIIMYLLPMLFVLMSSDLYAAEKCPGGEKRLHAEEECIPETLFNYLYCLEKSGGGRVEVARKDSTEKAKSLVIRLKGKGSGVVLKGEGDGGFSLDESVKAAVDFREKLDPTLAGRCENILTKIRKKVKKKTAADVEKEYQELKAKATQLQERLNMSADRNELEKIGIELNYKQEIDILKSQLASINRERIVSPGEQSLFDVTKLILAPDRIRDLDSSFKSMEDRAFFIKEPPMKGWRYSLTSEIDMAKTAMPLGDVNEFFEELQPEAKKFMSKNNVHLWKAPTDVTFLANANPVLEACAPLKITLSPFVLLQVISTREYVSFLYDITRANEASEAGLQTSLRVVEKLNKLDTEIKKNSTDATLQKEKLLSEMFRGDLAAVMLVNLTTAVLSTAGAQASLVSAQKKGNVLYMKFNLLFSNVIVEGNSTPSRVLVDQEWFIVTSPDAMFVVKTFIPSLDGRSYAFAWIDNWLSGLRIPLK